jgi:hypothetical protein
MRLARLVAVVVAFAGVVCPQGMEAQGLRNQVYLHVDRPGPNPDGIVWVQRTFVIAGWAFNCTGFPPDLSVWIYDPHEPWNGGGFVRVADAQVTAGLYRPDVADAFRGQPGCNVTPFSGFIITFPTPPPVGAQVFVVKGWSGGGRWENGVFVSPSAHQTFFGIVR